MMMMMMMMIVIYGLLKALRGVRNNN